MILGLLLASGVHAVPLCAVAQQNSVLESAMDAHLRVARSERELEFFDRYSIAAEASRERARRVLERLRSPGSASGSPSSSRAVALAIRALEPGSTGADAASARARERLLELVDALDLQPTPGMFAAGEPVEGRVVRVFVSPRYPPPERLQLSLSLVWTRPDGSQQVAYRGMAKAEAFEIAGFSVDIALPGSAPGPWRLCIEVERDGFAVRGAAIELQCVRALGERTAAAFAGLEQPADTRRALESWIALTSQRGLRTLSRVSAERQLARLEGQAASAGPYPWSLAFIGPAEEAEWVWRLDPPGTQAATLLLLCPSTEPAEATLSRSEWSSLRGWRVLSTHLPRGAPGEGSARELLARITESLAAEGESGPIVAVARGDSIGRLAMGFHGENARPYAAEILSMSTEPLSAESLEGPVPRWVFAPGGHAPLAESNVRPSTWWLDAPTIPLIGDFELPGRLASTLPFVLATLSASKAAK